MNKIQQYYRKYWLLRWLWWLGVVIPGVPFILVTLGILISMHWPKDYQSLLNISLDAEVEYFTFSAHGVKDTPASWSDELQQTYSQWQHLELNQIRSQHVSFGWQPYSDSVFNCSVDGKKIGFELGEKLSQLPKLKAVHLIGHSCGSFVVFGLCEALKKNRKDVVVQTTYLDPVSVYSGFSWDYGVENFGRCADFSDAYIDIHDTVPGSNQALLHAITFDVTQTRITNNLNYAPHAWPTMFYSNALKQQQVPIYFKSSKPFGVAIQKNTLIPWELSKKQGARLE